MLHLTETSSASDPSCPLSIRSSVFRWCYVGDRSVAPKPSPIKSRETTPSRIPPLAILSRAKEARIKIRFLLFLTVGNRAETDKNVTDVLG